MTTLLLIIAALLALSLLSILVLCLLVLRDPAEGCSACAMKEVPPSPLTPRGNREWPFR